MLQQSQQGLPDTIRVQAAKGFRANLGGGKISIVNPGDVVDVDRETAITLRFGEKAYMVDPQTPVRINPAYMPERKQAGAVPTDLQSRQIAAITESMDLLRKAFEASQIGPRQDKRAGA